VPHHEPLLNQDQIQSIDELMRIALQTCHNQLPSDQSHVLYAIFESFPHFASAPSTNVNATSLARTVLLENLLHSRMSLASGLTAQPFSQYNLHFWTPNMLIFLQKVPCCLWACFSSVASSL
jgi:hypothetical protein